MNEAGKVMSLFRRIFRNLLVVLVLAVLSPPQPAVATPYAAYLMDARTGETLYAVNADTPLPPASLTKMMTLYITFQEIEAGHMTLDTMITVSQNAANQAPSRLGLKAGQKIALRYLIRAAAVKSANDAAAAIGDALAGSPEKWGARMTTTARQLGMTHSTFKNANGLPAKGHVSTVHDMSVLGRHLFYDFPQYYNIFSRRIADAGMAQVANTNRKFLDAYDGADGIKTGYTAQAGFNLTASAERNGVRLIATIFGANSTAARNQKMAELLDIGFKKAKPGVGTVQPVAPAADPQTAPALVAQADEALPEVPGGAGKTLRLNLALANSPRPAARPVAQAVVADAGIKNAIDGAVAAAAAPPPPDTLEAQAAALVDAGAAPDAGSIVALAASTVTVKASALSQPLQLAVATGRPPQRKAPIYTDTTAQKAAPPAQPEVVTRVSTSGGEHWGVNLGHFSTRSEAERLLMKTQLAESATLGDGLRKVVERAGGYDAVFVGLNRDNADLACRRLQSRAMQCFTMGQ